jgi:hypothetical protein
MQQTAPQLTMIGHFDIWTLTVETEKTKHVYQARDFDDALTEIGRAVITGGKRITLMDDAKTVLDVHLHVEDVERSK